MSKYSFCPLNGFHDAASGPPFEKRKDVEYKYNKTTILSDSICEEQLKAMINVGIVYTCGLRKEAGGGGLGRKPSSTRGKLSAELAGGPGQLTAWWLCIQAPGGPLSLHSGGMPVDIPQQGSKHGHLCSGERARLWREEKAGGDTAGAEGAAGRSVG